MRIRSTIPLLFIFFFFILQMGCKESSPVVTPVNPLIIAIDDVTCTEVFLTLSLAGTETNRTVSLKRGDSIIATISIGETDSLFIDDGLLPKQTYTYSLVKENWSASIQATTQDTTSHEVQWQFPDTLGAMGLIRDVWVFSRDNAWAVGEIYLADSTGNINIGNPYNAAHWDGSKWELKQITVRDFGTGTGYYPLKSIFAFAPNDIWFASSADFIHWDGGQYSSKAFFMTQIPFDGQVNKIWGTSANHLYCVGRTGAIYHYTGSGSWSKMESNTTVDLQDIWGIDDSHVWATGTNTNDVHSVVLKYDGKQWTTIYDNTNSAQTNLFYFSTLWTDKSEYLFLDGGGLHKLTTANKFIGAQIITGKKYPSYHLRSTSRRDMFDLGQASEVAHFNGVSWYLYPELKAINEGFAWFYSVHPTNDFVLIGGVSLSALNGFPVVIRGYR